MRKLNAEQIEVLNKADKQAKQTAQKRVRDNSIKNVDAGLFSSQALRNAPAFNPMMTLGKACTQVAYDILEKVWQGKDKREPHWSNKKNEAIIVFANLLSNKRITPISISLDPYKKDSSGKVNRSRIELIKILEQHGYLERKSGHNAYKKGKRESSRIAPTPKCLKLFQNAENADTNREYREPVVLKERRRSDKHYPQNLRFEDTDEVFNKTATVKDLCEFIESMNKLYARHTIELPPNEKLNTNFHFVFSGSFDGWGRMTVCGGINNYQKLPKRNGGKRTKILIDGEKTVERDFSGTHVMMLYAREGEQYKGNDVYGDICHEKSDLRDLRPIFKTALLRMLNAKTRKAASGAIYKAIYPDKGKENEEENEECRNLQLILKKHGLRISDIMTMIDKYHKRIAHHFYTVPAPCYELTNLEARIALDIMSYFMQRDIPILTVHESFIVQEKYSGWLERVMGIAYRKRTGFKCNVK